MTGSDELMISAILNREEFSYNFREVHPEGDTVSVSLHGALCASLDFRKGFVTIYGESLNSRKSAKVFNAILRTFTECHAKSDHGKWEIVVPVGLEVEFSGQTLKVPFCKRNSGLFLTNV